MRPESRSAVAIAGLLCLLLTDILPARSTRSAPPPAILLRHATLLDGVAAGPQLDVAIVLRAGRIESVRPDRNGDTPAVGAPDSVIDLRGAWVVPGLIDAHVHMGVSRLWGEPDSIAAQRALDRGVTTVRSMGNVPGFRDTALRDLYLAGDSRLPRLLAAGEWVLPVVGEDWLADFPTVRPLLTPATPADSALRLSPGPGWRLTGNSAAIDSVVGLLAARGVDWVKVFATGRGGVASSDPKAPFLSESDVRAAVLAARRRGLQVAAHAHGDEGIRAAVLAGARTIEHGTYASEETLRLMGERGTCLVPTISALSEPSPDSVVRARAAGMRVAVQESVRRARDLGIPVIAGTDADYSPATNGLLVELAALANAGLAPDEVMRAATSHAAECLGIADRTGTVAAGLDADLLVLDGDPRSDLALLDSPRMVILGGRLVRRVPLASVVRSVLASEGIEAARAHARELHRSHVDSLRYGEYELIGLGYRLLMERRVPEGLAMFEVNVEFHPESPSSWDALGQAFLAAGRRDDARQAFARAVDLAERQRHARLPEFRARLDAIPADTTKGRTRDRRTNFRRS